MRSDLLSDDETSLLIGSISAARIVPAGANLLRDGASAGCLYILVDGWACRYTLTRDGHRQMHALLVPGDVCNLDSLLLPATTYGVRTLTEASLLVLPRDRAAELCARHPGIAQTFVRLAFIENAILSQLAVSLGRRSARTRLAHLLCELDVRLAGPERGNFGSFVLPLTQEQLADALGLTAVHINRMMKTLAGEGVIVRRHRTIMIPDIARLRRIGEFNPVYLHDARESTRLMAERSPSSVSSVERLSTSPTT